MKQMGLFRNSKQVNKELIKKMTSPQRKRSSVVAGQPGGNVSNSIAKRVAVAQDRAMELINEMLSQQPNIEQKLILDADELNAYVDKCIEKGIVSLDSEGSGLDSIEDFDCGISLYSPGLPAIYAPYRHTDMQLNVLPGQLPESDIKQVLNRIVEASRNGSLKVILANAKYDMRITKNSNNLDNYIRPYWDVILASNFLNENEPSGLKYLWDKYVWKNEVPKNLKTFDKLFDKLGFNWFDWNKVYVYAANDALMTYQVYEFQKEFLHKGGKHTSSQELDRAARLYMDIEMPLIEILCEMEDTGVKIDVGLASKLEEEYKRKLQEVIKTTNSLIEQYDMSNLSLEAKSKLGTPINIGSPAQVSIILYDVLKLKQIKGKKRGTGEDVLEALIEQNPEHRKVMEQILEYRGLSKLLSTYIVKIPKEVKQKTNRAHGQFNQYGAVTGRTSSKDPNLQNIPSKNKDIRPMFMAGEGMYLISGDFKQQEPRVLAHLSGDAELIQAYRDGKDLYSWIASIIFNKPYNECLEFEPTTGEYQPEGDKVRENSKSIILGIMYGRGAKAIASQIKSTLQEAQQIIDTFNGSFPTVPSYVSGRVEFCKNNGYVTTAYGRKRRLPDLSLPEFEVTDLQGNELEDKMIESHILQQMRDAKFYDRHEIRNYWKGQGVIVKDNGGFIAQAERQVINSEVQGTAADITKKAMVEVSADKELRDLGFKMLMTVHDEIIGEAPKENAVRAKDRLSEVMIASCSDVIKVPMDTDTEIVERWFGEDLTNNLTK